MRTKKTHIRSDRVIVCRKFEVSFPSQSEDLVLFSLDTHHFDSICILIYEVFKRPLGVFCIFMGGISNELQNSIIMHLVVLDVYDAQQSYVVDMPTYVEATIPRNIRIQVSCFCV